MWVILFACLLFAYGNSFHCAFQYDDFSVLNVPAVKGGLWQIPHLFDGTYWYCATRGVVMTTFNLDYAVWQVNPTGYHITNFLLHFACMWLVFCISRRLLAKIYDKDVQYSLAGVVALLFGLSPIQVYGVTYITQRMEVMAALSVLLCLFLYMRGNTLLVFVVFVLGCFCKQTAFITPGIILLYIVFYGGSHFYRWRPFFYTLVLFLTGGLIYSWAMQMNAPMMEAVYGRSGHQTLPFLQNVNLDLMIKTIGDYYSLVLFPAPYRLALDMKDTAYIVTGDIPVGVYFTTRLFLYSFPIAAVLLLLKNPTKRKLYLFCVFLSLLSLAIYTVLLPLLTDKMVVYRAYLVCFPVYLALTIVLYETLPRRALWPVVLSIICVFGFWSYSTNANFVTQKTLWASEMKMSPNKIRPVYNYATVLQHTAGDSDNIFEAANLYIRVIGLLKDKHAAGTATEGDWRCTIKAYHNLGTIYRDLGMYEQALHCFQKINWLPVAQANIEQLELCIAIGKYSEDKR